MARAQKIQALMRRLKHRRQPQSIASLAEALNCTERDVKDIIRQLRDEHLIPINYNRRANGYNLDKTYGESFELNEAWFSSSELHALMTSHHLLANIQPGWLDAYIGPLKDRLEKVLHNASQDFNQL
jgi:proteasome accessory factor C